MRYRSSNRAGLLALQALCIACCVNVTTYAQNNFNQANIDQGRAGEPAQRSDPSAAPNSQALGPFFTRSARFGIPISVKNEQNIYSEVRLFVSKNRGASWELYRREQPRPCEVSFTANEDGEYWFGISLIDKNNQAHPAVNQIKPKLMVTIDRQKPQFFFDVQVGQGGSLTGKWQASDPLLDDSTIKIEYRPIVFATASEPEWKTVSVPFQADSQRGQTQDSYTWWPDANIYDFIVRAEIRDRAGNVSTVERQVTLPKLAARPTELQARNRTQLPSHLASTQGGPPSSVDPFSRTDLNTNSSSIPWSNQARDPRSTNNAQNPQTPSANIATSAIENFGNQNAVASTLRPLQEPRLEATQNRSQDTLQASNLNNFEAPPRRQELGGLTNSNHQGDFPLQPGTIGTESTTTTRTTPGTTRQAPPSTNPQTQLVSQAGDGKFSKSGSSNEGIAQSQPASPANASPQRFARLVSSSRFKFAYEVESVGPSGVAQVELYVTQDNGNTWEAYGIDTDSISPFPVEAPGEGLFGFRIVVTSKDGLVGQRPQPGSPADIWIDIDLTKPQGDIQSWQHGKGSEAGKLVINWTAQDSRLHERPITLKYAENAQGPWKVIAEGLPNDGNYAWRITSNTPRVAYLRMEVRDRAGNVLVVQPPNPADLGGISPRGRINGFEQFEETSQRRSTSFNRPY